MAEETETKTKANVDDVLDRLKALSSERTQWDVLWQKVEDSIGGGGSEFTRFSTEADELNNYLGDTTAMRSIQVASLAMLAISFGAAQFRLRPIHETIKDNPAAIDYFSKVTDVMRSEMLNPKSNLFNALYQREVMRYKYGTTALSLWVIPEGENNRFVLKTIPLSQVYLDEGTDGKVDTIYRKMNMVTIRELVGTYGYDNVSSVSKKKFDDKDYNAKVSVLHAVEPRLEILKDEEGKPKEGNLNMPFLSVHIEIEEKHRIKESGLTYFPYFVERPNKRAHEKYGRSEAIFALPDIREALEIALDLVYVANQIGDPAIGVFSGSLIDPINRTPGSVTVFKNDAISGSKTPFFNLMELVGDPRFLVDYQERIQKKIAEWFNIDRLLDFANETQMTLGETRIRAQIRQQTLGFPVEQRKQDVYNPLIEAWYNLDRKYEKLPAMPDEVSALLDSDDEIYQIDYFTDFERDKRTLEVAAIMDVWNAAATISQIQQSPDALDNLNADVSIREVGKMAFIDGIFRSEEEITKTREDREKARQAQQAMAQLQQGADTGKTLMEAANVGQPRPA